MGEQYIGVMSGTSLDAVDISLCEISENACKEIASDDYAYGSRIKQDILRAISEPLSLKEVGELNHRLGKNYSSALNTFIKENNVDKTKVVAIGLHGQTLWHEPNSAHPFSMQLGDASIVSKEVGIDVVCDFRSGDIALGGEGAPFTPAFHKMMFKDNNTAVLNLGGIANITILGRKALGYDIAPANMLLDAWIQKIKDEPYDAGGTWASGGSVDADLLSKLLDEPFFEKEYPKSTGRELFNIKWLEDKLSSGEYNPQDVQRTLVELLVRCVDKEVKSHKVKELVLCGGGAYNCFVESRLEELLKISVKKSDDFGVDAGSLESMAFAWLAYKRIHKEVIDLKDITGAKENGILGAIYAAY